MDSKYLEVDTYFEHTKIFLIKFLRFLLKMVSDHWILIWNLKNGYTLLKWDGWVWFHYWALYLCVFFFFLTAGYLVYEFDKFWFEEKPESIMYFNVYREKFHEKIKGLLLDCNVSLTLKIWLIRSIFYFYHILHTRQNLYVVTEIIWSITHLIYNFLQKYFRNSI